MSNGLLIDGASSTGSTEDNKRRSEPLEYEENSKRGHFDGDKGHMVPDPQATPSPALAPRNLKTNIEFIVPGYKVGLIIGTKGETLKRIERDTDTRITFDPLTTPNPSDMPERRVYVTGLPDDVARAKQHILEKVQGGPMVSGGSLQDPNTMTLGALANAAHFTPSSDPLVILSQMPVFKDAHGNILPSVQFMIPNNKVGLVIGRGGETVRELQEKSQAKVFIAPDSTTVPNQQERLISISGHEEHIATAKTLLEEILEGTGILGALANRNMAANVPGAQTVDLIVPDNMVGMLIGKKGEYFKLMTNTSRAKIVVDPPQSTGTPTRTVSITGTPESIAIARQMIHEKLAPTNRLEGNIYYALEGHGPSFYSNPQNSYYPNDSSYAAFNPYFSPTAAAAAAAPASCYPPHTSSTNTTSTAIATNNLTKEQIDYYYAYYYDYYIKAGLQSAEAVKAALAAMEAAGIPYHSASPTSTNQGGSPSDSKAPDTLTTSKTEEAVPETASSSDHSKAAAEEEEIDSEKDKVVSHDSASKDTDNQSTKEPSVEPPTLTDASS